MPRPPAKRNRRTPAESCESVQKAKPQSQYVQCIDNSDDSDGLVTAIPGFSNPSRGLTVMTGALGNVDIENAPEHIPKKTRTPISKSREQAIESSPIADRVGTGSRPPTRARGYSSTLSLAGRQGDAGSRIPNTPFESSLLSNFKRRPRQPSILQMMQADDGSSDFEDDDFLGGLSPEDESTPLNVARGGSLLSKLPTDSVIPPISTPRSLQERKKTPTLTEAQGTHSHGQLLNKSPTRTSHSADTVWDLSTSDIELPSTPAAVEMFSQTLAPPLSSSPFSPKKGFFDLRNCLDPKAGRGKLNERYPAPRYKKSKGMQVKLPTTVLQQKFLPRRRLLQRRDGNSDDSEDDFLHVDSEEDELSYLTSRRIRGSRNRGLERTNSRVKVKSKGANLGAGKKRMTDNMRNSGTNKSSNVTVSASSTKPPQHKQGITYLSRDSEADKENQIMPDDSSLLSSPRACEDESDLPILNPAKRLFSLELERQARKFADVDKWQMEFEDIPFSGSQSSPLR